MRAQAVGLLPDFLVGLEEIAEVAGGGAQRGGGVAEPALDGGEHVEHDADGGPEAGVFRAEMEAAFAVAGGCRGRGRGRGLRGGGDAGGAEGGRGAGRMAGGGSPRQALVRAIAEPIAPLPRLTDADRDSISAEIAEGDVVMRYLLASVLG